MTKIEETKAVYEKTNEPIRKRIELSDTSVQTLKNFERKTGLTWDDTVNAAIACFAANPGTHLQDALKARYEAQMKRLNQEFPPAKTEE